LAGGLIHFGLLGVVTFLAPLCASMGEL
jgi:hypothetical protein